jgi:transcription-repair coupling factor (superfamily II helicase)
LSFYKRLASVTDLEALAELMEEVVDRYGPAPPKLAILEQAQKLRMAAQRAGVVSIIRRPGLWRIQLDPEGALPAALADSLDRWPDSKVSESGEVALPARENGSLDEVQRFLSELAAPA